MNSKKIIAFTGALLCAAAVNAQTFNTYTENDGLANDNVHCLTIDANDEPWFGTQSGVSHFDGSSWTTYNTTSDPSMADDNILAIAAMSNGDLWIGTDFGVSVYDGSTWTTYTENDGLGNDQIKCITEGANGDVWFGTNDGASVYDGSNWTSFGTTEGLPFGGVNDIQLHSNGNVWFGTGLGGVYIYDGSSFTSLEEADGLLNDKVRTIGFDQQGRAWVGTADGITVFDANNAFDINYTTMFSLPAPDTLNPIEDLAMDSEGNVWVGVYVDYLVTEGGVCLFDGNWTQYEPSDGLAGPVVRQLAIDGNDDVWVTTSTGVTKINDAPVGIEDDNVTSQFSLYPNPAKDFITVELTSADHARKQLEFYNSNLQQLWVEQLTTGQQQHLISVANLPPGIYFVKVDAQVSKIIIH